MKITKEKYNKVIIALDGIRCDNRENQIENLRQIDDDVMQHIERKGYCKYILGENNKFIRTLTKKGYEVLASGSYEKYLWYRTKENYRLWLPIAISIFVVFISLLQFLHYKESENRTKILEDKVGQFDASLKLLNSRQTFLDSIQKQNEIRIRTMDSVMINM